MSVLFVSPIVMCRYALPVFALTPLAFAIALSETKQGEIPRELNAPMREEGLLDQQLIYPKSG